MRGFRPVSATSILALLAVGVVPLAAGSVLAAPMVFVANLAGSNENPATSSLGTGTAVVIVDPAANTLDITIVFSGLTGNTTASHIHCCEATPGANVNVGVATTTPTFTGFPLGVTSGSYHSVLDLTLASSYNLAFINGSFDPSHTVAGAEAALIAGIENVETYLNIHSSLFPGGEVRGTLVAPKLSPLVSASAGSNAIAAAGAVDAVFTAGSGPLPFVGLLTLPMSQLTDVLQRIAGTNQIAGAQAGHESIRQFLGLVLDPFAGTRPVQPGSPGGSELWGAGYGSSQILAANSSAGSPKESNGGGGVAVGYDATIAPGAAIGAAFLYDYRTFDTARDFGSGHQDGYHFGLYGAVDSGLVYLRAAGDYSIFDVHADRSIPISGSVDTYQSGYTAHGYGGRAEAGLHYAGAGFDVTPFAAVVADSITVPSFSETTVSGATVFALHADKHSFERTRSELGVGFDNLLPDGAVGPAVFNVRFGWAHEFKTSNATQVAFVPFPNQTFTVEAARIRDAGFVEAGLSMPIAPGVTLGGNIEGDFGTTLSYGGSAQLRFAW